MAVWCRVKTMHPGKNVCTYFVSSASYTSFVTHSLSLHLFLSPSLCVLSITASTFPHFESTSTSVTALLNGFEVEITYAKSLSTCFIFIFRSSSTQEAISYQSNPAPYKQPVYLPPAQSNNQQTTPTPTPPPGPNPFGPAPHQPSTYVPSVPFSQEKSRQFAVESKEPFRNYTTVPSAPVVAEATRVESPLPMVVALYDHEVRTFVGFVRISNIFEKFYFVLEISFISHFVVCIFHLG